MKEHYENLPLFEIVCNDEDNTGIRYLSIVKKPAIKVKGLAFANKRYDLQPQEFESYWHTHPNCYSKDTKIMTRDGFKLLSDITIGESILTINKDTQSPEWGKCINTFKVYGEKAVYIHNNNLKMLVSTNHPFFGYKLDRKSKLNKPHKIESYTDIPSNFKFLKSSKWNGDDIQSININGIDIDIESYLKLMGYYLSEGSTTIKKNGKLQSNISQTKYMDIFKKDLSQIDIKNVVW